VVYDMDAYPVALVSAVPINTGVPLLVSSKKDKLYPLIGTDFFKTIEFF